MRSLLRFLILSLDLPLQAITAQAPQISTGAISGSVRDELGKPVREALVVIDAETKPIRVRTNEDGRFRIERIPIGGHELNVARIGFRPHRSRISIGDVELSVNVVIEHVPMMLDTIAVRVARSGIHGRVSTTGISLLPHEPRSLQGAIIEVLDSPYRTRTGSDGRFSISALGEGAYSLLVRLDRYRSRIVSAYVPPEGGLEINVVLDSTISDWQRREDMELREISRRLREANNPSAFVSAVELVGPEHMTLKEALRDAPSALSRGLFVKDDVSCIYVDGEPRPGMTAGDFLAEEVHAVELYGLDGKGRTQMPLKAWQSGTFCGTGTRIGPLGRPELVRGERPVRMEMDNIARVVVIWLKRGR